MRIALWHSGHEISDTVCNAIKEGLPQADLIWSAPENYAGSEYILGYDLHIAYGILRGCGEVFKQCNRYKKPWINIDRGFWRPNHYDGYYRISLNGTQQTTGLAKLDPDYDRWAQLGLEIEPVKQNGLYDLICPPTLAVVHFFNAPFPTIDHQAIWRDKNCLRPLQSDLDLAKQVITFNSSVGWEALRQGIPVVSDENHSFVGSYLKQVDTMSQLDIEARRRMFAVMASLQLTLAEIKSGKLWPLIQRLLQYGLA